MKKEDIKYQSTIIGNIPIVWRVEHIEKIAYVDKKTLNSKTPLNYEFQYISLSDVQNGKLNSNLAKYKFIDAPSRARRIVSENDVLMSTVRPNLKGFTCIKNEVKDVIASTGFSILSCKENYCPEFLYNVLFSYNIDSQIYALVVGSNYPAINSTDVRKLKVPVPPLKEQQKIAEILSTWDLGIEKQEQLIEKKKEFKKGLMHRLLSGNVRFKEFNDEWKLCEIGEFIEEYKEKSTISNQYPVLTSSRNGLVLQTEYFKNNQITTNDNVGYNIIPYGYITFRTRSDDGTFVFNQNKIIEKGIVSYFYPVFEFNDKINTYFAIIWMNNCIDKQISKEIVGTSQLVLSLNKLKKFKISLPSIEEQDKISEVLIESDKEIELLQKELETFKLQKKGLMQRLLTGEVRVKL